MDKEAERLAKSLRARIDAFEEGQPGPVMADEAADEALRLRDAADLFRYDDDTPKVSVTVPQPVAELLARFYLCRYRALDQAKSRPAEREESRAYATTWHTFAGLAVPAGLVPDHGPRRVPTQEMAARENEVLGWLQKASALAEQERAALGSTPAQLATRRLDQAIRLFEQFRAVTSDEVPDIDLHMPRCLSNMGMAWLMRYRLTGEPGELDQAVKAARSAVTMTPADDVPRRVIYLGNLVQVLQDRYHLRRRPADIDQAIELQDALVGLTGREDPLWSDREGFLVALLCTRYAAAGDEEDITKALGRGQALLSALGYPAREDQPTLGSAIGLANCHLARFHARDRAGLPARPDLDQAIMLYEWAARRLPDSDQELPGALSNLAEALHQRFGPGGEGADLADIAQAERCARRALALTGPRDPRRAEFLYNLGVISADHARFGGGGTAALRQAADVLGEAMTMPGVPPVTRLSAARGRGECAGLLRDWDASIAAFWQAVRLLSQVAWRGVDRETNERLLADVEGVAGVAAAHAIMAGRLEQAVELLEFGRGVLWAGLLAGDTGRLRHVAPDLARQLAELADELDRIEQAVAADDDPRLADRQMRTARRRDVLTAEAEQVLARQSHAPPAGFADLRAAASDGPVVLVNISPQRCDALIVSSSGIRLLPLPELRFDDLKIVIGQFDRAMETAILARRDHGRTDWRAEERLSEVLAWLWRTTVGPVLAELGHSRAPAPGAPYPRVWWCPVGRLSFLPLHAAGLHGGGGSSPGERGKSALDLVTSSYAPNLRSLLSRAELSPSQPPRELLVIKTLRTPSPECWIPGYPTALLSGGNAIPATVREALPAFAYLHVSAHGSQDRESPSNGHIKLTGGKLWLSDVRPGQYPRGQFAFLSACDTAAGGTRLSDEMITLATAFQYAGFRHVIGTTWPIPDDVAISVEKQVYGDLVRDGVLRPGLAPGALRSALAAERDRAPGQPSRWLPFIHAGR